MTPTAAMKISKKNWAWAQSIANQGYNNQLTQLDFERQMRAELKALRAPTPVREEDRMTLQDIINAMQEAVDHRRTALGPAKGMSVPYFGPLASAMPGTLRDVQWWIDRLKEIAQ